VLSVVRERRNWIYLAFGAAIIARIVWPPEEPRDPRPLAALLLPLTALGVARLTQCEMWQRAAGTAVLAVALVKIGAGGSLAPTALNDPLFWGVAAAVALAASAVTGRWPMMAATSSALAGAATMVGIALPLFTDFASRFPALTVEAARASLMTLSYQLSTPATVLLFALCLQAIVLDRSRRRNRGRISAACRGALLAGLTLMLTDASALNVATPRSMLVLAVLLGLVESQARTPTPAADLGPLWRRMNPAFWTPIAVLLAVELLFSLVLLHAPGTGDVSSFWIPWSSTLVANGLVEGYRLNDTDYPPLSAIMFLLIAKAALGASSTIFLGLKISLVILLFVITYCFWRWTRDMVLTSLLALSLYISGVALGYVDLYYAPTLILSLWALQQRRIALFSVLFAITSLIKWQPLIIAPFLVLHALSIRSPSDDMRPSFWRRVAELAGPAMVVLLVTGGIFGAAPLLRSLSRALQHTYLSGTALNFNWLVTSYLEFFRPELYGGLRDGMVQLIHVNPQLPWVRLIQLAFVLFYLAVLGRLVKNRKSFPAALECALAGCLAYFTLNIGVHEHHLFIGTVLAAAAPAFVPGTLTRAFLVNAMSNLNLIMFYGITGQPLGFSPIVGIDVSVLLAAVNVVLFVVFWSEIVFGQTVGARPTGAIAPSAVAGGPHLAHR